MSALPRLLMLALASSALALGACDDGVEDGSNSNNDVNNDENNDPNNDNPNNDVNNEDDDLARDCVQACEVMIDCRGVWVNIGLCSPDEIEGSFERCRDRVCSHPGRARDLIDLLPILAECTEEAHDFLRDAELCTGVPLQESICDDAVDEDNDGATDCADADCARSPACREVICDDGQDNEGDDLVDCDDPDCSAQEVCAELVCGDEADNDNDGLIDCDDPDCEPACAEGYRYVLLEDIDIGLPSDYPGADIDALSIKRGDEEFFAQSLAPHSAVSCFRSRSCDKEALLGLPDGYTGQEGAPECFGGGDIEDGLFTALNGGFVVVDFGDHLILSGDEIMIYELGTTLCGRFNDDPVKVSVSAYPDLETFVELGVAEVGSLRVSVP